jgi:hypothetical protein
MELTGAEGQRSMIPIDPLIGRVGRLLTARGIGWAVAGGWAIDLFLARLTRAHADVDIAVWRDEQTQLREALPYWAFSVADSGQLRPWVPGTLIAAPLHELHATNPGERQPVEFLLNERDGTDWIYRRDPNIRLALSKAIWSDGPVPCLAPEVVLLYKSKAPRATDEADFRNVLPHLSNAARGWLIDALTQTNASHSWLTALRDAEA